MTMDQIWDEVNAIWVTITTMNNRVLTPVWTFTEGMHNTLKAHRVSLQKNLSTTIDQLESLTYKAVLAVETLTRTMISYIDSTLARVIEDIRYTISPYMKAISEYVEDAVRLLEETGEMDYAYVDNEIAWAVYDLEAQIDNVVSYIDGQVGGAVATIDSRMDGMQSQIDGISGVSIETVQSMIAESVDAVYIVLGDRLGQLSAQLTVKINKVYTDVVEDIDLLQTWLRNQHELLEAKLADIVRDAKSYIDSKAAEIYKYLVSQSGALKRYVDDEVSKVEGRVSTAVDELEGVINIRLYDLESTLRAEREQIVDSLIVAMTNMELRIMGDVHLLGANIASLRSRQNWRQGFFDIFVGTPELSFLKVLLRDKEMFAEYKPYWQALFVRVMGEG